MAIFQPAAEIQIGSKGFIFKPGRDPPVVRPRRSKPQRREKIAHKSKKLVDQRPPMMGIIFRRIDPLGGGPSAWPLDMSQGGAQRFCASARLDALSRKMPPEEARTAPSIEKA